ncbi:hypothetical protein GGR92_001301 [Spirosoma lacussanchae]|uniref:Uncharacterized protein n=1 Tax=Spirosoma sordidisoli TaxID=2502893 RepID=A0A4Q2UUV5_9BACT|nr:MULTISPECIES: hypothetical protein [Spirosoma]RYC71635.1 hypothetical protein EQG79_05745 [Spirosoma sordidisoli]
MKFISSAGSFELSILGYGKKATNWRERNRLQCRVSTLLGQQADTQSAPLQTWEVGRLLNGLRALWNKAASHIDVSFPEPGLSVEATALPNDSYRLQIQLDHALTPAWHTYPGFPVKINLLLNRRQLQEAIQDLSGQVAAYPER